MSFYQTVQHNVVIGISYKTAKTDLRDKLSLCETQQREFSKELLLIPWCKECVILSTCNRTEFYLVVDSNVESVNEEVLKLWSSYSDVEWAEIKKVHYSYSHIEGVRHLYRVIASLDSLVMGEGQIMGQVKDAFFRSQKSNSVGMYLNQLFQSAFALGKLVRSETSINEGAVSISYAAVELCKKVFPNLSDAKVALLGAGEMGYLAALHLKQAGVKEVAVFNRTLSKALEISEEVGAKAYALGNLAQKLFNFDIVIGATGSSVPVVNKAMVEQSLKLRKGNPQILVDIALPKDMDHDIQQLDAAYLFNIDDLQEVIKENRDKRLESSKAAEKIIEAKLNDFSLWYHSQKIVPTIKNLKDSLECVSAKELEKFQNKLGSKNFEIAKELVRGIVAKWLHNPMEELKILSEEGYSKEASALVNRMFRLEQNPPCSEKTIEENFNES